MGKAKLVIRNTKIPDTEKRKCITGDIVIDEDGVVSEIGGTFEAFTDGCRVIEANGDYALPAFVDLHCHLRDPGFTQKEDIVTGTAAAVAGGYKTVVAMPNTRPAADSPEIIDYEYKKAAGSGSCEVLPAACITVGSAGKKLVDFDILHNAGAVAFTDDGRPVPDANVMRDAMKRCSEKDYLIISHSEELSLSAGGVMNDGKTAHMLGVKGIPESAESVAVAREILLAEETGCRLHLAHISSAASLDLIRSAKKRGARITCETCPHYFAFCDEDVAFYGANAKMSPPLRSRKSVGAVIEALADGTIDCISTDHAPHTEAEKKAGLVFAPNGITGLQTSFSAAVTYLLNEGFIDIYRLITLMSGKPSEILGLASGIKLGQKADIVIADLDKSFIVTENMLKSRSFNTPFLGLSLNGFIEHTIIDGELRF